jgi:hypothetical protein
MGSSIGLMEIDTLLDFNVTYNESFQVSCPLLPNPNLKHSSWVLRKLQKGRQII